MPDVKIGVLNIKTGFMNAACSVAKTHEDVDAMCQTKAGAVLIGSITPLERAGNPEPRWFAGNGFALNSFGMPNGGIDFYKQELPAMAKKIHDSDKVAVLSIAGFSKQDYMDLATMADGSGVDMLELNFGCPNISVDGAQKPIVSFDPETMSDIISLVQSVTGLPLAIKLSPYSNPADLKNAAEVLESKGVAAVVTCNTFPNGFYPNEEGKSVLANDLAGLSGRAMLLIGLGQVRQFRELLPEGIAVIGVGGIETKEDAKMYYDAGASVVQTATLIVRDGHAAIDRLAE